MKKLLIMFLLSPVALFAATNAQAYPATGIACSTPIMHTAAPTEALQKYAGVYALNEEFAVIISVEDGKLYGLAPGDAEKTEFVQVSGNKFRIKGPETEAEFIEENGRVQYLLVNMKGGLKMKKVK